MALSIQLAELQRTTPQAKPLKTTTRCGCSLDAAVAKRRTPVDFADSAAGIALGRRGFGGSAPNYFQM
jgi:hypothetical protein